MVSLANGSTTGLKDASQFKGYRGNAACASVGAAAAQRPAPRYPRSTAARPSASLMQRA